MELTQIAQVAGLGLVAGILITMVRQQRAEMALVLSLVAGGLIFVFVAVRLAGLIGLFQDLAARAQVNAFYLGTVLKIIGVAYLAEFGGQVLRDAGDSAVASKVELAAKVVILILAVPIIVAILDTVTRLLQ